MKAFYGTFGLAWDLRARGKAKGLASVRLALRWGMAMHLTHGSAWHVERIHDGEQWANTRADGISSIRSEGGEPQDSSVGCPSSPMPLVCCVNFLLLAAWFVFVGSNVVHFARRVEVVVFGGVVVSYVLVLSALLLVGIFLGALLRYFRLRLFELKSMMLDAVVFALSVVSFIVRVALDLVGEEQCPLFVDAVVFFLIGAGLSCLFASCFQKLYEYFGEDSNRFLLISIAAGTMVGGSLSLGEWSVRELSGCFLSVAVFVLFLSLVWGERRGVAPARPAAEVSDGRDRIDRGAAVPIFASGFSGGFAYWGLLGNAPADLISAACVAAAALPAFVWLFCTALDYLIKESLVAKMTQPVYVILFLLYFFGEAGASFLASFGIVAFAVFSVLLSLCAVCEHVRRDGLLVSRLADRLTMQLSLGVFVGLIVAEVVWTTPSSVSFIGLAIIVSALTVVLGAVGRRNTWPGEESLLCYDSATCPMRSLRPVRGVSIDETAHAGGRFLQKCDDISKRYGLTERQKEILVFLAKGRNAEHISKELTISSNTAKTHIYNVFQKLGIHSQQELIDMVESWRLVS